MSPAEGVSGRGQAGLNPGRRVADILALASLALLIVVGVLAAAMAERVNRAADRIAHSLEVEAGANDLLKGVEDLQLAERGYLLTRSSAYLSPFEQARATIPQALDKLRSLVAGDPDQTARAASRKAPIDDMLTTAAGEVELGRNGQFTEAVETVKSGRESQIFQSFRAILDAFNKGEGDLLDNWLAAEGRSRAIMFGLVAVGLANAATAAIGVLLMRAAYLRELHAPASAPIEGTRMGEGAEGAPVPTQKPDSTGLAAGAISHDFNNLMTVVIGNLESAGLRLGRLRPQDAAAIGPSIAAAMQGAKSAVSLTRQIDPPGMAAHGRTESPPAEAPVENARAPSARPGEVVLLVEDDEDVRDSTVALLRELGYSVIAARDGAEALAQLQGSERVDILFTDVVLPQGMNGRALAVEAAALRPALPVLFTTGHARNGVIHDGRLDPGVQFLAKPYTRQEIAQKLRAALDAAGKAL
jgi:CHASE3 domain sensor protein/CheY-like chemotaxis protein